MTCGADRLRAELAYVAFHLHWSLDSLLDLEHADRRAYLALVQQFAGGR